MSQGTRGELGTPPPHEPRQEPLLALRFAAPSGSLRQPFAGDLVERPAVVVERGVLAGRLLPAPYRHVNVLRADLDGVNPAAGGLAGDDLRTGAAERLVTDLTRPGVLAHRDGEHFDRLRRRVLGFLADLDGWQV